MAIGWLYFQEMAVISGPRVREGTPTRAAIAKARPLAALSPQLQQAHGAIVDLRAKETTQLQALLRLAPTEYRSVCSARRCGIAPPSCHGKTKKRKQKSFENKESLRW